MPRPDLPSLQSGIAGWDAILNDIIDAIHRRPFPVVTVADVATLNLNFDPADYEDCLVMVQSPSRALYTSDGSAWAAL